MQQHPNTAPHARPAPARVRSFSRATWLSGSRLIMRGATRAAGRNGLPEDRATGQLVGQAGAYRHHCRRGSRRGPTRERLRSSVPVKNKTGNRGARGGRS
eukprot:scaffold12191_cov126-Isochrysis_galbana.AAC.3